MKFEGFFSSNTPLKVEGIIKSFASIALFIFLLGGLSNIISGFTYYDEFQINDPEFERMKKERDVIDWYIQEKAKYNANNSSYESLAELELEKDTKLSSIVVKPAEFEKIHRVKWKLVLNGLGICLVSLLGFCFIQLICNLSIKLD